MGSKTRQEIINASTVMFVPWTPKGRLVGKLNAEEESSRWNKAPRMANVQYQPCGRHALREREMQDLQAG